MDSMITARTTKRMTRTTTETETAISVVLHILLKSLLSRFLLPQYILPPIGLTLSFSVRINPLCHHSPNNDNMSSYTLYIYLYIPFSQILSSPHLLVYCQPTTLYSRSLISLSLCSILISPLRSDILALLLYP